MTAFAPQASNDHSHKYEEFIQDSDECPTCRGLGRIPRDNDNLVALIPVSDKRLKPSKTWLFVAIAVLICLLIGGTLLFFLISRTVSVDSNATLIVPDNITLVKQPGILQKEQLYIKFLVPINITNRNYLPISVTSLELTSLLYGDRRLNTTTNNTIVTIPMTKEKVHYVGMEIVLDPKTYSRLIDVCQDTSPVLNRLSMNFQISATISYLSHTENSSVTLYNRKVCCQALKPKGDNPVINPDPCNINKPSYL